MHGLILKCTAGRVYLCAVGEHLLLLPQIMEGALLQDDRTGSEGGTPHSPPTSPHLAQDDALASVNEWTVRIASHTAEILEMALRRLPRLSQLGAAQLAADLEYLCDVLGTLGVVVPDALAAWAAGAAAPDAKAARALLADVTGDEARRAIQTVIALRGWPPMNSS